MIPIISCAIAIAFADPDIQLCRQFRTELCDADIGGCSAAVGFLVLMNPIAIFLQ
ncbi:hypothetical protein [Paracoccus sp. SM22M-07]|uniref:hypothetical protein n=1 Tax=Paracoccus sp. SM22M-07 TaxID=1520813 RepID=UPI00147CE2BB|nr:hypothetical protein [Paracoccus sp. SM22M-07]